MNIKNGTHLRFVAALLVLVATVVPVGAVPPGRQATPGSQPTENKIEPKALVLLQKMNANYKSMRSFSCYFDEYNPIRAGMHEETRHVRAAFRRPNSVALTEIVAGRTSTYSTDGKKLYVMLACTPDEYTEVPYYDGAPWAISRLASSGRHLGEGLVQLMMQGDVFPQPYAGMNLSSLTMQEHTLPDGIPVATVSARWESTEHNQVTWVEQSYTVGTENYTLYSSARSASYDPAVDTVRFARPYRNPKIRDSAFVPPEGSRRLPVCHITSIDNETVLLDTCARNSINREDTLVVCTDETLRVPKAKLLVERVRKHDCRASELQGGGLRPGETCIVVEHAAGSASTIRHNRNAALAAHLLTRLKETYRDIRTLSCDFDEGEIGIEGKPAFTTHAHIDVERPDHLAFSMTGGLRDGAVIANEHGSCLMLTETPQVYTDIPGRLDSPFAAIVPLGRSVACSWLYDLYTGNGLGPGATMHRVSIRMQRRKGETVVLGTWQSDDNLLGLWENWKFIIGTQDHLIHEVSYESDFVSRAHIVRYRNQKVNRKLPPSLFEPPKAFEAIPMAHLVNVSEDYVTLDKGSLDGLKVGDKLGVYDERWIDNYNATALIEGIQPHTSRALILAATGLHAGEVGILLKRPVPAAAPKVQPPFRDSS